MRITERKISSVKPYENNPRLNDNAIDAVVASIQEFGFRQPVVVDSEGVIICGHTRYKAAMAMELEKIPVHVATDLTPEQVKAYRIADNKAAELSDWDYDLLPVELADLKEMDFDIDALGFSTDELAKILETDISDGLTDPDSIPEPPDDPITQPGDLWVLGGHRLLCGDSSLSEDVDRLLDGANIHLVNTDPPYNVKVEPRSNNAIAVGISSFSSFQKGENHHQQYDAGKNPERTKSTHKKMRPKDRPLENDFVSDEEFDRLLMAWFGNASRVLEPGRSFYIWGGYSNCINYPPAIKANEFYFSQIIVWVKEHAVLTRKDFMGNHEMCFYGWKEGAGHKWYGPSNAGCLVSQKNQPNENGSPD